MLFLSLHFYMGTANNILSSFKTTMGVLRQGCYLALFGGVLNILLTLWLASTMGLPGVYLATILSEIFTTFFPGGYYTFRDGFGLPSGKYLFTMAWRMLLTMGMGGFVYWLCSLPGEVTWGWFILQCGVCALVPNIILLVLFGRTQAFRDLLKRAERILAQRAQK